MTMKTLVCKSTSESKYIWPDDVAVTLGDDVVTTPEFFIADMNAGNAMLVANVTPPDDWKGCKYLFSNGIWSPNPGWTDPNNPPSIPQES